jgi:aerobic-type carbon monoxide dehydrogenase small subunit (CoxS/CutS family)
MALAPAVDDPRELSPEDVDGLMAGQLCRCTGYAAIVRAVARAGRASRASGTRRRRG